VVNEQLFNHYLIQQRGGELSELSDRKTVQRPAFRFGPILEPLFPNLDETRDKLDEIETLESTFVPSD